MIKEYKTLILIIIILLIVAILIGLIIWKWENWQENIGSYTEKTICYINGVQQDCSDIPDKEHFCHDGICSMNGVCPGENKSKTVEECIKEVSK